MVAAGWFAFNPPKAATDPLRVERGRLEKVKKDAVRAKKDANEAEKELKRRTWDLKPEELGSRVMETFTRLSERRGIVVSTLSTGRTIVGAGLQQSGFTAVVEGPFDAVVGALHDLERPETKRALNSVAVAPKEAEGSEPGRVSATIMLTAFVRRDEE